MLTVWSPFVQYISTVTWIYLNIYPFFLLQIEIHGSIFDLFDHFETEKQVSARDENVGLSAVAVGKFPHAEFVLK